MRSFGWILAIAISLIGSTALADDDEVTCHLVRTPRTMIVCDEISITSALPRPFVMLTRTRDTYERPEPERDMAREVVRSVRRDPF